MQARAVYDLCTARPHEPPDVRFTPDQFAVYNAGYQMALTMALSVIQAAEERFKMHTRTRKLETRAKRARE
jgi:hypothetical protein